MLQKLISCFLLQCSIPFDHDLLKFEKVVADEQLLEQPFVLGLESLCNQLKKLLFAQPYLFHD